jgi:hypothetical protein
MLIKPVVVHAQIALLADITERLCILPQRLKPPHFLECALSVLTASILMQEQPFAQIVPQVSSTTMTLIKPVLLHAQTAIQADITKVQCAFPQRPLPPLLQVFAQHVRLASGPILQEHQYARLA